MSITQPTGVGRLSIPVLVLAHLLGIVVGATVLGFLGAVFAAILQIKNHDDTFTIIGLSFLVGAVLPSVLLWRARRRSRRDAPNNHIQAEPRNSNARVVWALAATIICAVIGTLLFVNSDDTGGSKVQKTAKIDIRGIYPGMTADAATQLLNKTNWKCGNEIELWDASTNLSCDTPDGSLSITWGPITKTVYKVSFSFIAGGGTASVISDIESEYGVKLGAATVGMGGESRLKNGINLQLIADATNGYGLFVSSDALLEAERKARRESEKQAKPTPRL
jgi:hypothetical protein